MATTSNNDYMNSNDAYTIDTFLANRLTSTFITAKNIKSKSLRINNLTIDGSLKHLDVDANNYNYESVKVISSDPWKQSWTVHNKAFNMDQKETGVLLSSGKIAIITSFDTIDVQKTELSVLPESVNGQFISNVIEPFYVNHFNLFNNNENETNVSTLKQEFDIKNALFTSHYKVINKLDGNFTYVNSDTYVPKQMPFSIVQSLKFKKGNVDKFMMFHDVYTKNNLIKVTFNNNIIHHPQFNDGVYVLFGQGYTLDNREVAFASCYSFSDYSKVKNLGFNVYHTNTNRCYNTFEIDVSTSDVSVDIFSSIISDYDFKQPLIEVKKMAITLFSSGMAPSLTLQRIRSSHIQQWNNIWQTNIQIIPKSGIPENKEKEIGYLNKIIKISLYNLYVITKESNKLDFTSTGYILDRDGSIINNGDTWIIPLFLILKPELAKNMLEYKYQMLDQSQQIATSYGYNGAQFPYIETILGGKKETLWNMNNALFVFNNAMMSINTWNYFRTSKDKDWLEKKGFVVLRNIADFLSSIVEYDDESQTYVLKNSIGLNGLMSKQNNTFTNNKIKIALAFAIEASYELTYKPKDEWIKIYMNLPLLYIDGSKDILKFDQDSIEEDTFNILELFFILIPYYSRIYFSFDDTIGVYHKPQSILKNIDYYINKVKTRYVNHPYNLALLGILYGLYTQYDESYASIYEETLQQYIKTYTNGIWNNMKNFLTSSTENSINMNAMLLHTLLQGIAETKFKGGVSETRFYYEEMKMTYRKSANMPKHWHSLKTTKIGYNKESNITLNKLLYIASSN